MSKSFLSIAFAVLAVVLSAGYPAWSFLPGGNGKEWKMPEGAEIKWQDDGLYMHGKISHGMEISIPEGLDADRFRFMNICMSTAEYTSARLYFAGKDEDFSKERMIRFPCRGMDMVNREAVDCFSRNKLWKGKIYKLRLHIVVRELDNSTLKFLYFSDNNGGMIKNGSFETPDIFQPSTPDKWVVKGGRISTAAQHGTQALELAAGGSAAADFELIRENPVEISFYHNLQGKGSVTLEHFDIFDKRISGETWELPAGNGYQKFVRQHNPPAGSAFVRMTFSAKADGSLFDSVNIREVVPAAYKLSRWSFSSWIWDNAMWNSTGKPVYFRTSFNIASPDKVQKMIFQIACRNIAVPGPSDRVEVFINGEPVTAGVSPLKWHWVSLFDLKPFLRKGKNVLAVKAVNEMSPGAIIGDIMVENAPGYGKRFLNSGTGAHWKCSGNFEENWQSVSFSDAHWRNARLRGQATPGSFCRLPYRFMGTAGSLTFEKLVFPEKIIAGKEMPVVMDLKLAADPGAENETVTADAAVFCHLIDPANDTVTKFKVLPLTGEMLRQKKAAVSFPLESRFLRDGEYLLRIYADRLAITAAPAGFTLNRIGNYIEKKVKVEGQRRPGLPQVKITGLEEVPRIVINGREHPALRFCHGSHTQVTTEESLDIIGRVENGQSQIMDVFSANTWFTDGEGNYDFSGMDTFFMSHLSRYPDTHFIIHWTLDTAGTRGAMRHWLLKHPAEFALDSSKSNQVGTYLATNNVASMASKLWRDAVAEATEKFVQHLANSPYADRIIGLMPSCGLSHEWLYWGSQAQGFMDYSEPFQAGFRAFLREKYPTLHALNVAWGKNFSSWDEVVVPDKAERMNRKYNDFLLFNENRSVIDLRMFLNHTVSSTITELLRAVKQASGGKMLAGVYYGYSLYVAGPYQAPFSGHHALGKVLDSPDLDFLISPVRYDDRGIGGASGSMIPVGSMRKHNKLYVSEADNRLVHSWDRNGRVDTLRDSKAIVEREFACSLVCGFGLEWLDFGEGWLPYDSRLCQVLENCQRVAKEVTAENRVRRDYDNAIAVVIDEKAIHHGAYDQRLFLNLVGIYPHLFRSGAEVHWYLLDDLDKLDPYKLIIFTPTVTRVDAEQKKLIDKLKNDQRTLVFLFSTGIYQNEKLNPAGIGELTGIKVKAVEGFGKRALRVNDRIADPSLKYLSSHYTFGFAEPVHFYIAPVPEKGDKVLFFLDGTNTPGMVKRDNGSWTAVYTSSPGLSAPVIRGLAESAGIRIFNTFTGDVTYAAKDFYAVHTLAGGMREFNVSPQATVAEELFSGRKFTVKNGKFNIELQPHSTVLFKVY